MKYKIEFTKKALKQVVKIPQQFKVNIFAGIYKLENSETWGDVKQLTNHQYDYRLRVGNYRVLFNATADMTIEVNDITIEEIKKRDDRTY